MKIGVHRFFWVGVSGFLEYNPTYKWNLINKPKSKQNITRNIEIKNKLTVTRGEVRGDNEGKG